MGYSLTAVSFHFQAMGTSSFSPTVTVYTANGADPSATSLGTLTNPTFTVGTTGEYTFTSTSGIALAASTTYFVVISSSGAEQNVSISNTTADAEDSGGVTGFSIANNSRFRNRGQTGAWSNWANPRRIKISGTITAADDDTAPTVSGTPTVNKKSLVITFNEALDTGSVPAPGDFTVEYTPSGGMETEVDVASGGVEVSGSTVTLTLDLALIGSDSGVKVTYAKPSSNPLQDAAGNDVADFTDTAVTNNSPDCPTGQPTDAFYTGCLTVTASAGVTASASSDFDITYDGTKTVDNIAYAGSNFLQIGFGTAFDADAMKDVIMRIGSTDFDFAEATRSGSSTSNGAATWSTMHGLTWEVGDRFSFSLTEESGGEKLTALVLTDPSNNTVPLSPAFDTDTTDYTARVAGGVTRITVTPALANSFATVEYKDSSNSDIDDADTTTNGQQIDLAAGANEINVKVTSVGANFTETYTVTVTRDTTAPTVSGTPTVNKKTLVITFDEALDTGSVPAPGDFTVEYTPNMGTETTVDVATGGVEVSGSTVTLTLVLALIGSDTGVKVSYAKPTGTDANPLRDLVENEVANFTDTAVTNNSPACPSTAPADAVWSVCIDVEKDPHSLEYGKGNGYGSYLGASATKFTFGPSELTPTITVVAPGLFRQRFDSSPNISNADAKALFENDYFVVDVGSESFDGDDVSRADGGSDVDLGWDRTGGPWDVGDRISMHLRELSGSEKLTRLVLTDTSNNTVPLSPVFDKDTTDYTARVAGGVTRITVTPTLANKFATIEYKDSSDDAIADADTTTNGQQIDLDAGANEINVKVTSVGGNFTKTYTVTVTRDNTAPTVSTTTLPTVNKKTLVITFDEALDTGSVPAPGAFTVEYTPSGQSETTVDVASGGVEVSGSTVTLTLALALIGSDTGVKVSYDKPTGTDANPLRDLVENEVADFDDKAVTNNSPDCPTGQPADAFYTACLTVESAFGSLRSVTTNFNITYDGTKRVDLISYSRINDFQIDFITHFDVDAMKDVIARVDGTDFDFADATRTGSSTSNGVATWSTDHGLTWERGDRFSFSLREESGGEKLTGLVLTDASNNRVPLSPAFDTDTTSYTAMAANGVARITVTPRLANRFATVEYLDSSNSEIDDADTTTQGQQIDLSAGANVIKVKVTSVGGNFTETYTVTVTGETIAPVLSTAAARDTTLTLTYNETLDGDSEPAPGDFTVTVGGTDTTPTDVAVSGRTVTLTLASAPAGDQDVTVSYEPGTNPIQDLTGNDAAGFSGQAVRLFGAVPEIVEEDSTVDRWGISLAFTGKLYALSRPDRGAFEVTVNGDPVALPDRPNVQVVIAGQRVQLILSEAVLPTDEVRVSYSPPYSNPLRARAEDGGEKVPAFSITLTNVSRIITGPRTANVRAAMGRGETRAFGTDDFPFKPGNVGRGFHGVRIVSLPALGTLALGGSAVKANDLVLLAALRAGRLTFAPAAGQDGLPYTSFDFKVSDGHKESGTATMTIDVYPVAAPSGFSVERLAPDGVRLSWSPPAAGGAAVTGYEVRFRKRPNFPDWTEVDGGAGARSHDFADADALEDVGCLPGYTCWFQVRAVTADGAGQPSRWVASRVGLRTPGAPGGPMVWTESSSTAVELRWWAPETDNGSGTAEGYRVEASGDGGTSWTRIADLGRAYTFTERGLDGAVAGRQYRVAAWNAAGQGPWSGTATPAAARFTGNYKTERAHESARVRIRVFNPDGSTIYGRWHVEGETPGSGGTFELEALDAWSAVKLEGLEPETDYEVEFNLTSDFSATDGDRRRKVSFSTLQRNVLAVSPPWVDVIGAPEEIERGGSESFEIALGVACRGTWNVSVEAPGGALSLTPSGVIALGCGEPNPATEITVTAAGHAAAETAVIRVSGKGSEQARPGADRLIRVKLTGAVQQPPPGVLLQTAVQGLTATFEDVPSEHGGNPFTVTLAFSEQVDGVQYLTLHEAFSVTGGRITRVSRTAPGGSERNRRWTLEVTPENGDDDVMLTLPANAPGLPDGRMLAAAPATLVPAEQRVALTQTAVTGPTATFEDVPGTHDGNPFTLTLRFSEHIAELTGTALQAAFTVTGGSVTGVERTDPGAAENNLGWTVTVTPEGDGAVALLLAADALGLSDGRELAAAPAALVQHGQPAEEQETVGLTASFETPPSEHGGDPFTLTLGFSENLDGVGYRTLHEAFSVTGGEITRVSRTDPGAAERNLRWTLEVRPFGIATVTITLPASAPGLPDGRTLAADASVTVPAEEAQQEQPQPVQPPPPLTASFSGVPSEHDGSAFSFTLGFSENLAGLTAATLRGALAVTGGAATGVVQSDPSGSEPNRRWTVTVTPEGSGEVAVTLAADALGLPGGRELVAAVAATVAGPPPPDPVAASFPSSAYQSDRHKGPSDRPQVVVAFDRPVAAIAASTPSVSVSGGRLASVSRWTREAGLENAWMFFLTPSGHGDMTFSLVANVACNAGGICTPDGGVLERVPGTRTIPGLPVLDVADARVAEGDGAKLEFQVTLSPGTGYTVTVRYETSDGTATAPEDYTATSGTLTFAPRQTSATVSVPVLDDNLDEGHETLTLTLSNPTNARIGDGTATGTIENADPLQKMWLSRFGRTVAGHVTDAVSDRLANPLTGAQVTVGGQSVNLAQAADGEDGKLLGEALTAVARVLGAPSGPAPGNGPDGFGAGPGSGSPGSGPGQAGAGLGVRGSADAGTPGRVPEGRDLLLGSAFHLAKEGEGRGPGLAAWGRVTLGGFDGEAPADDGRLRIDGEVITGILGADAEWNRLLAGVAISVSEGEGSFSQPGVDKGTIESTMTTVSPYARFMVTDRVSVWGLAGWGTGDMTIVQAANDRGQPERVSRTDLEMRLVAGGGRGALLEADEAAGFDLALRADAFYVETESDPISNEGSTTANASRMRLALEGSRAFRMEGGGTFTPGLELGLRHDGGDAETGTGVELGGRVAYEDPETGLSVEARARALIAHEDSNYKEWGASGAVRLAPGERGRGLSFSLAPTWGSASSGVDRLWGARDARGLAPEGAFEARQRLEGELGYGLGLFGDRFTGTPNLGFGLSDGSRDYRIGWRLTSAVRGDPGFEVNLDATRKEAANDNGPAEHGVMLRAAIRW